MDELIDGLYLDLSGELAAIRMYITYGASVKGVTRPYLQEYLYSEIQEETAHAQFLSEKIVALTGDLKILPIQPVKYCTDIYNMLCAVRDAEKLAITNYSDRIKQADMVGDIGLRTKLEEIVAEETHHYEGILLILNQFDEIKLTR